MTIHITHETNLVATWVGAYMYIPQENDILMVEDSFYRIKYRVFTKEDVRLEVSKLEEKNEFKGRLIEFHKSL